MEGQGHIFNFDLKKNQAQRAMLRDPVFSEQYFKGYLALVVSCDNLNLEQEILESSYS